MLAYNAGQGTADDVLAGRAKIPASTLQYIANAHKVMAATPAGVTTPPGAAATPAGTPGGMAAPGGPEYTPSGVRLPLNQGSGTTPPGQPSNPVASLPPDLRATFQQQLAAAAGNPDALAKVGDQINAAALQWANRAQKRVLSNAESTAMGLPPTGVYQMNAADGSVEKVQDPTAPVPIDQTPEAQNAKVLRDLGQNRLKEFQDNAVAGAQVKQKLDAMDALNVPAGGANVLANTDPNMMKALETAGVGTPAERQQWTWAQAYQGLSSQVALAMKPTGRLFGTELDFLKQGVSNIGQSPDTRAAINALQRTLANRAIQESNQAQNYFAANNGKMATPTGDIDSYLENKLGPIVQRAPPVPAGRAMTPVEDQAQRDFVLGNTAKGQSGLQPGQFYVNPYGKPAVFPYPGAPK